MTSHESPTWPASCPAWCQRDHLPDDHPDDRRHRSEAVTVPAVALRADEPIAVDLVVYVSATPQGPAYLTIEETEQPGGISITLPGAAALAAALRRTLDATGA